MTDKEELMKEVVMKDNMIRALKSGRHDEPPQLLQRTLQRSGDRNKMQRCERHGRHGEENR